MILRSRLGDLRRSVEALPEPTRVAMLDGIRANEIIVGAYSDRVGGVCPMLAAHRCGGRTSAGHFARAWDRFCRAERPRTARPEELLALEGLLEASLLDTESGAIAVESECTPA